MRRGIFISILVFLISFSDILVADNFRCLGSDGGTPFVNISHDVSTKQKIVYSNGLVKDFIYHEKLNQIVYRNTKNQIRALHLEDLQDHLLNFLDGKMSRVVENDLGRILTSNSTYYLDTNHSHVWHQYGNPNNITEHLFSEKGDIFSLEKFWKEKGGPLKSGKFNFSFLTYEAHRLFRRQCFVPGSVGSDLKIAKGNLFPYVHFYALKKGLLEDKVVVYRMAVNKVGSGGACPVEEMTQYPYSNLGEIKAFYYFNVDNVDAYAFHLADPKRNLFWDKPGECAYYNFKGKTPIFISAKHPVFATWKNGDGLSLHNLKNKSEVSFFKTMHQAQFGPENVWLAEDGQTLYSSVATSQDQGGRILVSTDLVNF